MSQAPVLNIPSDVLYTASKPSIPAGSDHVDNQLAPTSGSGTYSPGDVFYFDLPSANFADFQNSLYVRANINVVQPSNTGGSSFNVIGTPLYSWISKLETIINSTTYESISNLGPVANMFVNSQLNYSQKIGNSNFGYTGVSAGTVNGAQITVATGGTPITAPTVIPVSGPLPCVLSSCAQLVPMFACPLVRLQFTVAQLADVLTAGTGTNPIVPTSFTVSDIRLCYKSISFGPQVEQYVKQMMPNIMIKTTALQIMSQAVAAFQGQQDLTFNMRNQSIKSLFSILSPTAATTVNRLQDSQDLTNGNGTYQFNINSKYFPSFQLNTKTNKSQFLSEHKMAIAASSGHSIQSANMSITPTEFLTLGSTTTTMTQMGKFYVSSNCEKHMSNNYVMSGVSSRDAPIIFSINNSSGGVSVAATVVLIVLADAMLEIDVNSKNAKISS